MATLASHSAQVALQVDNSDLSSYDSGRRKKKHNQSEMKRRTD